MVSARDYKKVSQFRWYMWEKQWQQYAITKIRARTIYMHRMILGAEVREIVDHIDGNGLNNTRQNIRICSIRQNLWNTNRSTAKSGHRGVHWIKNTKKLRVQQVRNGKKFYAGDFISLNKAIEESKKLRRRLDGPFCPLP